MKINFISPKYNIKNQNGNNKENSRLNFCSKFAENPRDAFIKRNASNSASDKHMQVENESKAKAYFIAKYALLGKRNFNKLKQATQVGAKQEEFGRILKLSSKEFEKYLSIRLECGNGEDALDIAKFEDERYSKAVELMKRGFLSNQAYQFSLYEDDKFQKILNLSNFGIFQIPVTHIKSKKLTERIEELTAKGVVFLNNIGPLICDDKKFKNYSYFYNFTLDSSIISNYVHISSERKEYDAKTYLEQGLEPHAALKILDNTAAEISFNILKNRYGNRIASMLACLYDEDEDNFDEIARLIQNISQNPKKQTSDLSTEIRELIEKGANFEDLNNYIQSFDKEKLFEIAPAIKNYSPNQMLDFYVYHYENKSDILNENCLTHPNIEELLSNELVGGVELTKLLTIFPLTKKLIGEIPSDWLNNLNKNEILCAQRNIDKAISVFKESKNEEQFTRMLSKILKKKVKITRLPSGAYGKCYKLNIEGALDTTLKLYKNKNNSKTNGSYVEPQTALFVNNYSNKFVKMFFGKISSIEENNGYMVTQYLGAGVKPIETGGKTGFIIECADAFEDHNIIKNKIIDFGAIEARKITTKGGTK